MDFEDRRDAEAAFEKYTGFQVEDRRLKLDWDVGRDKKFEIKGTTERGPYFSYI